LQAQPHRQARVDLLCGDLGIEHRLALPQHPQTNGMVERFNGRIEEVLQSHHFRYGEEMETTPHRYLLLYNLQLSQPALGSKAHLQAMKDWHKLKPKLFRKQPCHLPGCDNVSCPEHGTRRVEWESSVRRRTLEFVFRLALKDDRDVSGFTINP